ncbi:hypothetical protein BKA57DRAFT_540789 [Linnemannia elongata]|nr:hypothetical protein BKA57DRAFT_540789 [Linnemannia elongata]
MPDKESIASTTIDESLATLFQKSVSLAVTDLTAESIARAAFVPAPFAAEAETTTVHTTSTVDKDSDPFANGPMINPGLNWARMVCAEPGCNRKSIENFSFSSYHCQEHGSAISARWRLDCVSFRFGSVSEPCSYASYQFLHPNDNNQTFQCEKHCRNGKRRIFRTRFRVQSEDFVLKAGGKNIVLISGKDFDRMAFDYSYSDEIKDNIRQIIKSYQNCLNFESDRSVTQRQAGMLQGLDARLPDDSKELRKIHNRYRDLLAEGYVYMVLYRNQGITASKMLPIKIGYTKDIDNRLDRYECPIHPDVLALIPSPPIQNGFVKAPPLLGAHLLEQILHVVLVQRQNDFHCSCGSRHAEVFDFEPVLGIKDEWKAAQSRVQDLTKQMNEWAVIIRNAGPALGYVSQVHRPMLDAIELKLKQADQPLYRNWKRQNPHRSTRKTLLDLIDACLSAHIKKDAWKNESSYQFSKSQTVCSPLMLK